MKVLSIMKHFRILFDLSVALGILLSFVSCSEDKHQELTTVNFQFDIQANGDPLIFDQEKYSTSSGQTITVERVKIYLSNIKLIEAGGEDFVVPDSYHLISFDNNQGTFVLKIENVPSRLQIESLQFSIGVDPEANTSIDHVGDLDPTNGMAWDWNTGYKFLLLEGRFFDSDVSNGKEIKMHIGTDKNYHTQIFTLSEAQSLEYEYTFYFSVDALAPFGALDLSEGTVFMNDPRGDQVANNFKEGFISLIGYEYSGL